MKLPFIVLSYGEFSESKKLFSYESEGVHTLPVFSNAETAYLFVNAMGKTLREFGDNRMLSPQICSERKHAYSMFVTISTLINDLTTIVFDPAPPGSIDISVGDIQNTKSIYEIIEELQEELVDSEDESPKQE